MSSFLTSVAYHVAEDSDIEYTVQPYFNYVALEYNQRQDLEMPCLYGEIVYEPPDAPTYYHDCKVLNFAQQFLYGEYSKRYIFDGSLGVLDEGQVQKVSKLYLLSKNSRAQATAAVRKTTGTDELSGHFPQHVKISLGGTQLKPRRQGLLSFLISKRSFAGEQAKYYMPYFVRNVTEVYSKDEEGNPLVDENGNVFARLDEDVLEDTLFKQETFDPDDAFLQVDPISHETNRNIYLSQLLRRLDLIPTQITHETIFFEVQKSVAGTVIQTFYISVSDKDSSTWEFVDTQVKPEVEYTYICYSWQYSSSDRTIRRSNTTQTFNQTIKIVQPPLPVPSVSFALENDVKNKYKFSIGLDLSVNSENGIFYEMYSGETEALKEREILFDIHKTKDRFVYETQFGVYEIYKTTTLPYISPNGKYRAIPEISTLESKSSLVGTSIQCLQTVQPFKKYYYVFRTINAYGYPSNPTAIYEVEMTEDADEVFLNTKVVDFLDPTKNKYKNFKTMMKLMQIIPSSEQLFFEPEDTLTDEELLGQPLLDPEGRQYIGYRNDNQEVVYTGYIDSDNSFVFYPNILPEFQAISLPLTERGLEVQSLSMFDGVELPTLGISDIDSMWKTFDTSGNVNNKGKKFKIRVVSNDSGRKIDLNVSFALKKN